jgi:hypothetical protein
LKTGDEEIMMIAKFAQERWVRSFLSTPVFTGTAQKEGGACKKSDSSFLGRDKGSSIRFQ